MRVVIVLTLFLALLAGCGDETETPNKAESPGEPAAQSPPPKEENAKPPDPKEGSAFRLASALDKVKRSPDWDLDLVRNGIRTDNPRDAIPAILEPRFVKAKDVTFMRPERRVITLQVGDDIRAYPVHILDQHELVNDVVGGKPVLVTWCPLCGSSVVYPRVVAGQTLTFGVSGYLFKSDVLMYDHQTESFWSQLALKAVAGPQTGTELEVLPSQVTSFGAYQKRHPEARVLSDDQGIVEPHQYVRQMYLGYDKSPRVAYPVGAQSGALFSKAEVVGIVVDGHARAYALKALRSLRDTWDDKVGGAFVMARFDHEGDSVTFLREGKLIPHQRMFWFAWYAFHPDTDLRATLGGGVIAKPGEIPVPKKKQ